MVLDLLRRVTGLWVVPCRVFVDFAIDLEAIVAGRSLPRADTMMIRALEILFLNGFRRELVVSLDDLRVITLCYNNAVPCCLCHFTCSLISDEIGIRSIGWALARM